MSLWDRIIQEREEAQFTLPFVRNKYPLLDQARGPSGVCGCESVVSDVSRLSSQGQHLRGLAANLTLYWNVMPIVGRLYIGHMTFPNALSLPAECAHRSATHACPIQMSSHHPLAPGQVHDAAWGGLGGTDTSASRFVID